MLPVPLNRAALAAPPPNVRSPRYATQGLSEGFVHFGVGAFHRSHQALYLDELIETRGARQWAICGVGILERDRAISRALAEQDFLYTLIERNRAWSSARIIASVTSHVLG